MFLDPDMVRGMEDMIDHRLAELAAACRASYALLLCLLL